MIRRRRQMFLIGELMDRSSVGISRLAVCHQLQLVVGEQEDKLSRLQPGQFSVMTTRLISPIASGPLR